MECSSLIRSPTAIPAPPLRPYPARQASSAVAAAARILDEALSAFRPDGDVAGGAGIGQATMQAAWDGQTALLTALSEPLQGLAGVDGVVATVTAATVVADNVPVLAAVMATFQHVDVSKPPPTHCYLPSHLSRDLLCISWTRSDLLGAMAQWPSALLPIECCNNRSRQRDVSVHHGTFRAAVPWQTTIARLGRSCHMASNQPTIQQLEALQRLAFRLLKVCTAQRLYCQSD